MTLDVSSTSAAQNKCWLASRMLLQLQMTYKLESQTFVVKWRVNDVQLKIVKDMCEKLIKMSMEINQYIYLFHMQLANLEWQTIEFLEF